MMREVALMGLFLGVPQTSSHLGLNPLLVLGWIRNLGLDPLFRDIINTLVEGVNAAGVDKIAGEFRLSQETLRRVIAFAKRERQRREQENGQRENYMEETREMARMCNFNKKSISLMCHPQ